MRQGRCVRGQPRATPTSTAAVMLSHSQKMALHDAYLMQGHARPLNEGKNARASAVL